jgi:hypothetical protein
VAIGENVSQYLDFFPQGPFDGESPGVNLRTHVFDDHAADSSQWAFACLERTHVPPLDGLTIVDESKCLSLNLQNEYKYRSTIEINDQGRVGERYVKREWPKRPRAILRDLEMARDSLWHGSSARASAD